jgi:heterodisulfide reductase subunit C
MQSDTRQAQAKVNEIDPRAKQEVIQQLGSLDLAYCFQCGVCSGSCPTVSKMEYGPRKIMHMLRLGLVDPVLNSRDIWMCVSCFSCSARCPQGIEIADVMSTLRNMSLDRGVAKDEEATFSRTFVNVIQRHGRMFEMEALIRYYASKPGLSALRSILRQAGLGMNMFRKGKISLQPERVEGVEEVKEIFAKIHRGGES